MKMRFLGHSAFLIENLLIDPFISENPKTTIKAEDVRCEIICVTHSHHDHLGDAFEIAESNDVVIVSSTEISEHAHSKGVNAEKMNTGGEIKIHGWNIKMVEATHSTHIGHAAGFVLRKSRKKSTMQGIPDSLAI